MTQNFLLIEYLYNYSTLKFHLKMIENWFKVSFFMNFHVYLQNVQICSSVGLLQCFQVLISFTTQQCPSCSAISWPVIPLLALEKILMLCFFEFFKSISTVRSSPVKHAKWPVQQLRVKLERQRPERTLWQLTHRFFSFARENSNGTFLVIFKLLFYRVA